MGTKQEALSGGIYLVTTSQQDKPPVPVSVYYPCRSSRGNPLAVTVILECQHSTHISPVCPTRWALLCALFWAALVLSRQPGEAHPPCTDLGQALHLFKVTFRQGCQALGVQDACHTFGRPTRPQVKLQRS